MLGKLLFKLSGRNLESWYYVKAVIPFFGKKHFGKTIVSRKSPTIGWRI